MPEPYYTTATKLRTELGVDSTTLPDAAALPLIETAEDMLDELLGPRSVDEDTGRKVVEADVKAWQFTKLSRATTVLAAQIYKNPDLGGAAMFNRVKGPDFEFEGRMIGEITSRVLAPLNQSGLRMNTARATPNAGRGRYDSFFAATRHDGT